MAFESGFIVVKDTKLNVYEIESNKNYFVESYGDETKFDLIRDTDKGTFAFVIYNNDVEKYAIYDAKDGEKVFEKKDYYNVYESHPELKYGYYLLQNVVYDTKNWEKVKDMSSYVNSSSDEPYDILSVNANGPQIYYVIRKNCTDGIAPYCESTSIMNSSFKELFNLKPKELYEIASNGNIAIQNDNGFKLYNSNGTLLRTSKQYDELLGMYKDYSAVVDNGYLKLINNNDQVVTSFTKWTDNLLFHSALSGYYTYSGTTNGDPKVNGLYLVVEDTSIESGNLGSGLEYYYGTENGETGVIKTEGVGGYAKPVLYLYPEKDNTKVTVKFENAELLTTTYPKYNSIWEVTANTNGDLYDASGRYYYGLYWEESAAKKVDFSEGFYVEKEEALSFLEEQLDEIGLTEREANEFIMYWLPILEKNEKNLVYFELTESREDFNKLNINPKPDSLLRVAIHIKKVNEKTNIKPQVFNKFERNGFAAVEWGGFQVK